MPVIEALRLGFLSGVTAIALALGLAGSFSLPADPALAVADDADPALIWIADNGFHTDLILPRARLAEGSGPLAQAVGSLPPGDWVAVGWGDARFYPDIRPITARLPDGARAFFWPDNASVVLLDPIRGEPQDAYRAGSLHPVAISEAGLEALRRRLERALAVENGAPVPDQPSQVGDGRFFVGTERFWIGHLCNHWSGELLHAAGLPVRPFRTISSSEIVRMAHSKAEPAGAPRDDDEMSGPDA